MKEHLFYTFLGIFVATAIVTLLGITQIISIQDKYLTPLFTALLIELVGAVIAMYKGVNFFEEEAKEETEAKIAATSDHNVEKEIITNTANSPTDCLTPKVRKRVIAILGNGSALTINDIVKEIYGWNYDSDQKDIILEIIGELVHEKLIAPAINRIDAYQMVTQ